MKTAFLTFEDFHGRRNIGSSRIRARWLIERWCEAGPDLGEAELFKFGQKYDAVIYQKAYWWEHAESFKGIKILDICDPDFLHWGYPIKRMIEACDAITCSTEKLAIAFTNFAGNKPVYLIPDCVLDPEQLPQKQHFRKVRTVSWFGYAENFPMLDAAVSALVKRKLELLVIASKAYQPKETGKGKISLRNLPWSPATWQDDLLRSDLVINPQSNGGRFAYKSDNKTIQAWALGLPVAHDDKELDRIMALTPEERQAYARERRQWVIDNRDVKSAIEQFKKVIDDVFAIKAAEKIQQ